MRSCPNCGTYIPDGGKVCLRCGWKPESDGDIFDNPILRYMQEAFEKSSAQMTEDDKLPDEFKERDLAAAGYIGPAFVYSLIKGGGSELVKYHAKQSAMLLGLHVLNGVVGAVPYLGKPAKKLNTLLLIALAFLGARNAYFGRKEPVPFVGQIFGAITEML